MAPCHRTVFETGPGPTPGSQSNDSPGRWTCTTDLTGPNGARCFCAIPG